MAHAVKHGDHVSLPRIANAGPVDAAHSHPTVVMDENVRLDEEAQDLAMDVLRLLHIEVVTHVPAGG
jgi:hypothetical protein